MTISKSNKIYFASATVLCAAIGFFVTGVDDTGNTVLKPAVSVSDLPSAQRAHIPVTAHELHKKPEDSEIKALETAGIRKADASLDEVAESIAQENDLLTKEDALEMVLWQQQRGYPSLTPGGEVETSPYEHYENKILEDLAREGDPQAMLVLARKTFSASGDYEAAESLYYDASVRGYTVSLAELGNLSISKANKALREGNGVQAKEHFKNAYAWFEVGVIRGDKALEFSKRAYDVNFSEEEKLEIHQTANNYYSSLSEERQSLGFDPFENDYPVGLEILFGSIQ